jgi:ubiquitin carboxyl-terminal hydrolase 7
MIHEPHLLNPINYDSRAETGFVGLKNQGATCYLNSLLQTLYSIAYFRRAVYKMPIDPSEVPTNSIPLALQRVFWRLQYENGAVDTKELTKSFGWDTIDSFLQHDVQELARVLCDNLETKMAKTSVDGTMKYLLEGVCKNYIRCINVNYESSRKETFYDLQLNVKGCTDVYKSFDQYIEEETLEGDNKYQAEGFGYQDAKKGCIFMSFPPVLMLHLKRFEYDIQRDMMYKINDRYDFPLELDLSKYLAEDSEQKQQDNTYTLFSVLVHSGDVSGGHYYAFMKPFFDEDQWYKFDDERVYKVKEKDAVNENYGGAADERKSKFFWLQPGGQTMYKKFTNAYMLVYIRKSEAGKILQRVRDTDVPDHLQKRFEQERLEKERRNAEKAEAWKYCYVRVGTNQHLRENCSDDLIRFDNVEPIRIKKDATVHDLKMKCQELFGIPAERQRFWKWEKRQNKTYRPNTILRYGDTTQLDRCFGMNSFTAYETPINLYLEESTAPPDQPPFAPLEKDDVLLFFKYYEPENGSITFVGTWLAKQRQTAGELVPIFNEIMGIDPNTPMLVFEEVKIDMVELMNQNATLKASEIICGDILIFQHQIKDKTLYEYPTAEDYFNYLFNRVNIKLYKLDDPKGEPIEIELLKNMRYEQVTAKIGQLEQINSSGEYIRLTGHSVIGDQGPKDRPFKTTDAKTLKDMITTTLNRISPILYYEILEIPLREMESKKEFTIAFFGKHNTEIQSFKILLDRKALVADLKKNLIEKIQQETNIVLKNNVWLYEIYNHRIYQIFEDDIPVSRISDQIDLQAVEIEDIELNPPKDVTVKSIQVLHFCKEQSNIRFFGSPFHIVVTQHDTVKDVKDKIQKKLEVKDEDFKRYKFTILTGGHAHMSKNEYLNDDDNFLTEFDKEPAYRCDNVLGMEHKDPNPRPTTNRWYDKPIVIKN